jgi:uncharacterized protein YijF (DUF1287 family)
MRRYDFGDAVSWYSPKGRLCSGTVVDVGLSVLVLDVGHGRQKEITWPVAYEQLALYVKK